MAQSIVEFWFDVIGRKRRAFTLVEVLVVIFAISILMAIFMPALRSARSQARNIACRSNLRQLFLASSGYTVENDGYYVAAASDIWKSMGGYHRWHGVRKNPDKPFEPNKGPLVTYLADGKVKQCPERVNFVKGQRWANNFEQGCGGYGYNMAYLGSRLWQAALPFKERYARTANISEVRRPSETLVFADCAMSRRAGDYIEYSFAEPPHPLVSGKVLTDMYTSPSVHFRHKKWANIGWADGHIDLREMAQFEEKNVYNVVSMNMKLGWFEPIDNSLFDLE